MKRAIAVPLLLVLLLVMDPVLAGSETGNAPLWFRALEPLGILIGIATLWVFHSSMTKVRGGALAKSYYILIGSVLAFIFSFALHSLIEFGVLPDNLMTALLFELSLYVGIILIGVSSVVSAKAFEGPARKSK